jgi:hypothetical protein
LFGQATPLVGLEGTAADGFQALAQYDCNADGVIDAQDPVFARLRLWSDANRDGQTDAEELLTLAQAGVLSLQLDPHAGGVDANGNVHQLVSSWTDTQGKVHQMADVWLQTDATQKMAQSQAGVL